MIVKIFRSITKAFAKIVDADISHFKNCAIGLLFLSKTPPVIRPVGSYQEVAT